MDSTPPPKKSTKDYATRRVDLEESLADSKLEGPISEKKTRSRKTSDSVSAAQPPIARSQALEQPAAPINEHTLPENKHMPAVEQVVVSATGNEKIRLAAIVGVCIILLACICACTVVTVAFLTNAPW